MTPERPPVFGVKRSPPRPLLDRAVKTLEGAGVTFALGGSGLLAALGLADSIRDWDLTTDADLERIAPLFAGASSVTSGPWGVHADHALANEAVEIICRFAFRTGEAVVRIPTVASARRDGIPIGSTEGWTIAHALLAEPPPVARAQALDQPPRRPTSSTA